MTDAEKICEFAAHAEGLLDAEIVPGVGRIYSRGEKEYPSVTTVLSHVADPESKARLEEWRQAVGEEGAERITREACDRGTSMHSLIERHFKGEIDKEADKGELGWGLYRGLRVFLENVEPIALEMPLWSDTLRVAGRTDCVGYYDGVLSLIDFKSSKREKRADEIKNYFLQCTLYAMMLYEQTGVECKQIVVLISSSEGMPQAFKRETRNYVKDAFNAVKCYHANFSA